MLYQSSEAQPNSRDGLGRQMFLYFLPILWGTFFQQLYNTADAVIIGQFAGKEALAAVGGSSAAIINLLVGFFMGLSNGATVIIAQGVGAQDRQIVSRAVHSGIALACAAGLVMTLGGIATAAPILGWMGTPVDVMEQSKVYLRLYYLGMVPNLVYNMGSGILRAVGDSKRPLYFLIVTTLVNILLDLLFVAVLRWGVPGVALATVLSQIISAILVLSVLIRSREAHRLIPRQLRFHWETLVRMIRIGIPSGIQMAMYSLSNLLIQSGVNSFGTDVVAGWTAFGKLDSLNWMGSGAFGTTVATFAGQSYGAKDYKKMGRVVKIGAEMNLVYAGFLSCCMFFGGRYALRLFLNDAAVIDCCRQMITWIATCYILFIPIELLSAVCRSAGDTLKPTIITICGICAFRTVWLFTVLRAWHSLPVLFLCYPLSWIITSTLFILYYYKGNWLHR